MGINIRKGTISDSDQLFALVKNFSTSFKPERSAFNECLSKLAADQSVCLLVADDNGYIIGYCLGFEHYAFYANGRVAWLEEIMVEEGHRLNGIGRKIIDDFEQWAKFKDCKLISLATRRAAEFYSALGYEESAIYFRKLL